MRKSSRTSPAPGAGITGPVTVIDPRAYRASARNAVMAFWVTAVVTAVLAATVLADWMHPILAMFCGGFLGAILGAVAWAAVRAWPVVRVLWWWTPEILLALGIVYGFIALCRHTSLPVRLVVLAVVGVPAGIPAIRRRIIAIAWCVIVRHRLRTSFTQFIRSNMAGSLPLILLARPTPVGERVWIYLRPGLSLPDVQARAGLLAVACHADQVVAERAGKSKAAYIRVDVKRREVFDADVANPLADLVDPDTPTRTRSLGIVPNALDLPDVADPAISNGNGKSAVATERPSPRKPSPTDVPIPRVVSADGEDVSDFI